MKQRGKRGRGRTLPSSKLPSMNRNCSASIASISLSCTSPVAVPTSASTPLLRPSNDRPCPGPSQTGDESATDRCQSEVAEHKIPLLHPYILEQELKASTGDLKPVGRESSLFALVVRVRGSRGVDHEAGGDEEVEDGLTRGRWGDG